MTKPPSKVKFAETSKGALPPTHQKFEVQQERTVVHILEMEDVLFHHDSAVMMPENPAGTSSTQGGGATPEQTKISGVKALALVFKQFEFNPKQKIVIAGHTDTSGGATYNFKLSDLRSKNVLYLLIGSQIDWAKICHEKQKIEDHKQILTWVFKKRHWPCNPGSIDNNWDSPLEQALTAFVTYYNMEYADKKKVARLDDNTVSTVKADGQKRWPVPLWEAVYNLYNDELCEVLADTPDQLNKRRLDTLKFVEDSKPYVACGESFPIQAKDKSDYRSQTNRRVEIRFFDDGEAPVLDCPKETGAVHKEKDCPLYHPDLYDPKYISPSDLYAVMYHVCFRFYDRIAKKLRDVPKGLVIKAFENDTIPVDIVQEEVVKSNDSCVYALKLQFKTALNDPNRKKLHFEFTTDNQWVFTDSDTVAPSVVTKKVDEVKKLALPDRFKYYDLPLRWSSRNYWTRYDGDMAKGDRFENVLTVHKKLKPFGGNVTAPDTPLIFCLDDVVLLDVKDGTQNIYDCDHIHPDCDVVPVDKGKPLSEKSRVKLFFIDQAKGLLNLYQPDATKPMSSRIPFKVNLLPTKADDSANARIVFFRDGFYTIGDKRTVADATYDPAKHVLGARAAVRNDADFHLHWPMGYNHTEFGSTGDYDLHYFHHQHLDGKRPVSYTISYVSISFMIDSRTQPANPPAPAAPINPKPSKADVKQFVDEFVYDAVRHWNKKRYYLEESPVTETSVVLRPFYFFDERETFVVPDPQPDNIDFDTRPDPAHPAVSNFGQLFANAEIGKARQVAIGGKSKFLALVCRDENGHWGPAYHWALRTEGYLYSLFKLNKSGGTDQNDVFNPKVPVTEHGDSFGAHTMAHELGHATGQPDEYVKTLYKPDPNDNYASPDFDQFMIQLSMPENVTSMMFHNGAPRLHHLWYPMHHLMEATKAVPLKTLLPDKTFVARLKRDTWDITYTRSLTAVGPSTRPADMALPMASAPQFEVAHSPLKRLSLALYDVGKDESSIKYFHPNQDAAPSPIQYQAVLVVRLLLSCQFTHGAWTGNQQAVRVFRLQQQWESYEIPSNPPAGKGYFRLVSGAGEIKNIFVHFLAGFLPSTSTSASLANNNYALDFHHANAPATGTRIPNAGGSVIIYDDVTADEFVRYALNIINPAAPLGQMSYLKTWTDARLGDSYTLEQF